MNSSGTSSTAESYSGGSLPGASGHEFEASWPTKSTPIGEPLGCATEPSAIRGAGRSPIHLHLHLHLHIRLRIHLHYAYTCTCTSRYTCTYTSAFAATCIHTDACGSICTDITHTSAGSDACTYHDACTRPFDDGDSGG